MVGRPLRRDAQRNRERILDAARELFAQRGLAVTLDDIAAHAGLGVGTVYRRFRSREELVEELFEERMRQVVALADEALATGGDPWQALIDLLEKITELQVADRGLKEVLLGSGGGRQRVARLRDQMRPRAEQLVRRAQAAGALRGDLAASDLPLLQLMLTAVAEVAPPGQAGLWRRFLTLLIDGLRAERAEATPLQEAPVSFQALDAVMCHWRPARLSD